LDRLGVCSNVFPDSKGRGGIGMKYSGKKQEKSFASGMNFYKLVWIFVFFSIYGYVFETTANLIEYGYFYNRQGLIYGPFSQVYGMGAIFLILCAEKLKMKKFVHLFLLCFLVGTIFEYVASFLQESVFGATSWDYKAMPFNINGRVNLLFSLAWGLGGAVALKWLYPVTNRLIESFPYKKGIILTWLIFSFLCYDIFISAAAVKRQQERLMAIAPTNSFEMYLDKKYPDSYLEKIYPGMVFKK
jgi:uncharacterized membrane protein